MNVEHGWEINCSKHSARFANLFKITEIIRNGQLGEFQSRHIIDFDKTLAFAKKSSCSEGQINIYRYHPVISLEYDSRNNRQSNNAVIYKSKRYHLSLNRELAVASLDIWLLCVPTIWLRTKNISQIGLFITLSLNGHFQCLLELLLLSLALGD